LLARPAIAVDEFLKRQASKGSAKAAIGKACTKEHLVTPVNLKESNITAL